MPYNFSPSSLSLLKECPRCFWLHFNKGIKRPEGIFPSLPGGMDKILKAHFDSFRDSDELPPELKGMDDEVTLFDDAELLKVWRNNFKGIQWTDEKGNFFRGAVDNILQKGKKLIVLDYKTRGYPLKEDTAKHYQDQLDIYNLLLRKNGYETEDYAYLLFYHPDRVNEDGDFVFHTDLIRMDISVKNAERIFKEAVKVLEGDMPEAPDNCQFCRWVDKCKLYD
ncbi:MAG: PD-(D/E)XK nuclease family protein [Thermoplasmatales archaeon]|nr:PD-(D/E)XK nuclease family protein [Thermoplasmatales archaeon]